jgi:thiamine-phosphate diphosphorylase
MIDSIRSSFSRAVTFGFSCHSISEAKQKQQEGYDYLFLGPIFPTPSKLPLGDPLGIELIGDALSLSIPVVFIGGINEDTLPAAVREGARRVAAIAALQAQADPTSAARKLKSMLTGQSLLT